MMDAHAARGGYLSFFLVVCILESFVAVNT
jgi:hypothetical protein